MKKIIAAVIACLFIASAFAGCGIGDPLNNNSSKSSSSSSSSKEKSTSSKTESKKTEKTKTYKDSFDGLVSYMKDKGYITSDSVKQSSEEKLPTIKGVDKDYGYEYIGAEKGVKYPNQNITIELYSFKNPEKNDYVQSVKKDGKFTLFDIDIEACLAVDGKYMMIYTDSNLKDGDAESDNYKAKKLAVEKFEAFNPTEK